MKQEDLFESCLTYQSHQLLQNFVLYAIGCEERAMIFQENLKSGAFDLCASFYILCHKFIRDFHRLVRSFERIFEDGIQLIQKLSSFENSFYYK